MINYKIELTKAFFEDLEKLDNSVRILIFKYLKKLENSTQPRAYGKELSGNLSGLVRFRINNYRLITKFEEDKLIIYALSVGKRSSIYKRFKV